MASRTFARLSSASLVSTLCLLALGAGCADQGEEIRSSSGERAAAPRPVNVTSALADGRTFEGDDGRLSVFVQKDGSVRYEGRLQGRSGNEMWLLEFTSTSLEPTKLKLGRPLRGEAGLSLYDLADPVGTMKLAEDGEITLSFAKTGLTGTSTVAPAAFDGTFWAKPSLECLVPATGNEPGGYVTNEDGSLAEYWVRDDAMAHPACAALAALAALR